MNSLLAFIFVSFAVTLGLTFVYTYLFLQERDRYLGIWAANWCLYSFRLAIQLLATQGYHSVALTIAEHVFNFTGSMLLFWGTYEFLGRKIPRWWPLVYLFGVAWILAASIGSLSFQLLSSPTYLFAGFVHAWAGIVFLRSNKIAGIGKYLTGWSFILWGIHKMDYPLLRPLEWFSPWGYLISALLELGVALGILLVYFDLARAELRSSESRFRLLYENAPIGYHSLDENGCMVEMNAAWLSELGYSRQEVIGRNFEDFIAPEQQSIFHGLFARFKEVGQIESVEFELVRKDGSYLIAAIDGRIARDSSCSFIQAQCVFRNVTERKQAQRALQQKTNQLEKLLETARRLTESLEFTQVLAQIGQSAREIIEADGCAIYLLEKDQQTLTPLVAVDPFYEAQILASPLTVSESFTGEGIMAKKAMIFNDAGDQDGGHQIPGTPVREKEHIMVAPFIVDGCVLGAMCLNRFNRIYDENDLALAQTFAAYASMAFKNAQVHDALRESETRYRSLFEASPSVMMLIDPETGRFVDINDAACRYYGYDRRTLAGMSINEINTLPAGETLQEMQRAKRGEQDYFHSQHRLAYGQIRQVEMYCGPVLLDQTDLLFSIVHDTTDREQREREMETIVAVTTALRPASTRAEMLPVILEQVCGLLQAKATALVIRDPSSGENVIEIATGIANSLSGQRLSPEEGIIGFVIATGRNYLNNNALADSLNFESSQTPAFSALGGVPLIAKDETIGALLVGRDEPFEESDLRLLNAIGDIAASAIQRQTLSEQTLQHARDMAQVSAIGRVLAETLSLPHIYARLVESVRGLFPDIATVFISRYEAERMQLFPVYAVLDGWAVDTAQLTALKESPSFHGNQAEAIHQRCPLVVNELPAQQLSVNRSAEKNRAAQSAVYVPLLSKGEVLGVFQVQSCSSGRFTKADVELLTIVGNTAAVVMQNADLLAETRRRLQRLDALHNIDKAITTNYDLDLILEVVLDQAVMQLNVDAADILLLEAPTQSLIYVRGCGFHTGSGSRPAHVFSGELSNRVVSERRIIELRDSGPETELQGPGSLLPNLNLEGFVAYFGVPLIAKGQVKGVLELYHRTALNPDAEWRDFLDTLARQTAIAVDNAGLFGELQRSNLELTLAYDTTLEGWASALELRDKETEGHSRRVVDLALRLARAMSVPADQLIHLRRGALMHDIGKMGIPDSILLKQGVLTPEDWEIMRQHPALAYELLSTIPFLRPALDIPQYHHEKWDGSGYPYSLKGEEIPLSARIFAVVDVWDALCSRRPYRPAWSEEDALAYIEENAGKHFDPKVVEAFFQILSLETELVKKISPSGIRVLG